MKRIISLLLVFAMAFGMVGCFSGCSTDDETMSRADWIEQLSIEFGLDQYAGNEQAFSDISSDDDIYAYVQSCMEWGILENTSSKEFEPDEDATVKFAIDTAVAASGANLKGLSAEDFARENGIIGDAFLDYNGNLTEKKAEEVIDWAKDLYLNCEREPVEKVVLQDSVTKLSEDVSATQISDTEYKVSGSGVADIKDGDVIILPPSKEYPAGLARKVISVKKNSDGSVTYDTIEPSIEEVCADLEVVSTVVPQKEDIILSDGVTWNTNDTALNHTGSIQLKPLVATTDNKPVVENTSKGLDFILDINFTEGGKLKFSQNWADLFKTSVDDTGKASVSKDFNSLFGMGEKVTVGGEMGFSAQSGLDDTSKLGELFDKTSIIPDKNLFGKDPYDNTDAIEAYKAGEITLDELKKELDLTADQHEKKVSCMTNKFKGSYEITGSLSIKNLYVEPEIKLKKVLGVPTGIDKFSVEVNYDVESTLTLKGEMTEELTVCTCPVAVGATGVTVNVQIILFANFNGELVVKAVIGNNTRMEYNDGKTKRTADKTSSLSANLSAQIDFGPGFKIDILFLGVNIIDTKITAAVRLKFDAGVEYKTGYSVGEDSITISRETDYTLKFSGYVPILTLSIGQSKSLANKLKLKFSWEIIGEKKAAKFEIGQENAVLWKEELVIKLRPEEETSENEANAFDPSDYLRLKKYFVYIDEKDQTTIEIENIPKGYTKNDLVWTTDDASIADVSGGVITGKGYGSTIVRVKTSDGIYSCAIAVNIGSEVVDFTPLDDVSIRV